VEIGERDGVAGIAVVGLATSVMRDSSLCAAAGSRWQGRGGEHGEQDEERMVSTRREIDSLRSGSPATKRLEVAHEQFGGAEEHPGLAAARQMHREDRVGVVRSG